VFTHNATAPQPTHREFPYLNILGADLTTSDKDGRAYIEIRAHDLKQHEGVAVVRGLVQKDQAAEAEGWVSQLLVKAYREPICLSFALAPVKAADVRAIWTATDTQRPARPVASVCASSSTRQLVQARRKRSGSNRSSPSSARLGAPSMSPVSSSAPACAFKHID
jgi:hypothetical protein